MKLRPAVAQRVVDRVASGLGKRVSVTDCAGRVLASTEAQAVGGAHRGALQVLAGERLELAQPGAAEIVLPLEYADEVIGALVVGVDPASGTDSARVAKMLAELFIHQATVVEQLPQQQWAKDKFVADLVRGRLTDPDDSVLHEARLFDIDLRQPHVVVVVDIAGIAQAFEAGRPAERSFPAITQTQRREQLHAQLLDKARAVAGLPAGAVFGFIDDRCLVMLAQLPGAAPDGCADQLLPALERMRAALEHGSESPVTAGVGRYYPSWQRLPQSYADARCALETGVALHGPRRVYSSAQLGLAGFVCSDDHVLKAGLARDLLAPLVREPELLATLTCFLGASLSPSQTAQALTIHRHTLAYRLDKITRLTGLDPRNFEAAATLYAALLHRKRQPDTR